MELVRIVPQSLCQALYPQIIQMAETTPQRLGWLGGETLRYVGVAILPMALGVMLLGGPIIAWLYGDGFAPAAEILTVLIWTVIPYAYVRYAAYVLLAMDRQHINLWVNIALSVVNVMFNLLLIPYWGALGAAVATFFSITLSAIGKQAYLRWYLSIRVPWPSKVWTPLIAAAVMGLVVWWLRQLPVVIVVPVAACLYSGGLIIGGYFTANELRVLRLDRVFAAMGFPTG
jgi:O-antigen/teichoic acid export membrane protein